MASHTHNAQVERLEVVDTGRRRRWSEEEKLRIVAETLESITRQWKGIQHVREPAVIARRSAKRRRRSM
jgi:transposase-like protein